VTRFEVRKGKVRLLREESNPSRFQGKIDSTTEMNYCLNCDHHPALKHYEKMSTSVLNEL
jgi:hypothetical protein